MTGRRRIETAEDAERLYLFDQTIYPAAVALDRGLYLAAGEMLPELNFVLDGGRGHLACLPLRREAYEGLRAGRLHEGDLRREDLGLGGALYLCSMYGADVEAGFEIFQVLRGGRGRLGAYAVTAAGKRACLRLGMRVVREDEEDGRAVGTEVVPAFLELGPELGDDR